MILPFLLSFPYAFVSLTKRAFVSQTHGTVSFSFSFVLFLFKFICFISSQQLHTTVFLLPQLGKTILAFITERGGAEQEIEDFTRLPKENDEAKRWAYKQQRV